MPIFTLRLWWFASWFQNFRRSWRVLRFWCSFEFTRDWWIFNFASLRIEFSFNDSSEHYKRVKSWRTM